MNEKPHHRIITSYGFCLFGLEIEPKPFRFLMSCNSEVFIINLTNNITITSTNVLDQRVRQASECDRIPVTITLLN